MLELPLETFLLSFHLIQYCFCFLLSCSFCLRLLELLFPFEIWIESPFDLVLLELPFEIWSWDLLARWTILTRGVIVWGARG